MRRKLLLVAAWITLFICLFASWDWILCVAVGVWLVGYRIPRDTLTDHDLRQLLNG